MLGNFFRRPTDRKACVNKKPKLSITSEILPQAETKGGTWNTFIFPWLLLEAALPTFNVKFLLKTIFWKGIYVIVTMYVHLLVTL
jgi:hypothetical protein